MTRTLLTLSLSCLLAAFAAAQDTSPSNAPPADQGNRGSMQSATTVRGCLSGTAGNYTLTDDQSGAVYALSGNIDNLASEIGHQVEVTGQPSANSTQDTNGTAASTATPGASAQQMLQVNTVKDIADHCGAGSSSGSSIAPVNATAAAGDQAAPAPASSDGGSATMAQTAPAATDPSASTPQNSEPAATPSRTPDSNTGTATNSLPATASPLPLAGVIGFGSLLAGLYIRK